MRKTALREEQAQMKRVAKIARKEAGDRLVESVGKYSKCLVNDFMETGEYVRSITTTTGVVYTRAYAVWCGIVQRSRAGGSFQNTFQHYEGTTVCDLWRNNFQSFAEWYVQQPGYLFGWDVDKDFLSDGKCYSPETCMLLPRSVNLLLSERSSKGLSLATYYHKKTGQTTWRHITGHHFSDFTEAVRFVMETKTARVAELRAEYQPLGVPASVFDRIQCAIDSLQSQEFSDEKSDFIFSEEEPCVAS